MSLELFSRKQRRNKGRMINVRVPRWNTPFEDSAQTQPTPLIAEAKVGAATPAPAALTQDKPSPAAQKRPHQPPREPAHPSITVDQAVLLDLYAQPPVMFIRAFVDVLGSVTAALWLSHAMETARQAGRADAEFELTTELCGRYTGMTRWEQDQARNKVRAKGIIKAERRAGRGRGIFYTLDIARLDELLRTQTVETWGLPPMPTLIPLSD